MPSTIEPDELVNFINKEKVFKKNVAPKVALFISASVLFTTENKKYSGLSYPIKNLDLIQLIKAPSFSNILVVTYDESGKTDYNKFPKNIVCGWIFCWGDRNACTRNIARAYFIKGDPVYVETDINKDVLKEQLDVLQATSAAETKDEAKIASSTTIITAAVTGGAAPAPTAPSVRSQSSALQNEGTLRAPTSVAGSAGLESAAVSQSLSASALLAEPAPTSESSTATSSVSAETTEETHSIKTDALSH